MGPDEFRRIRDEIERRVRALIEVAGSKGKGSTALLAEAVLLAAGERVGTFTSPHLERWTERVRIAGREVDYVGVEGFGLTLESTELLNG